jgi:hypothetical protein
MIAQIKRHFVSVGLISCFAILLWNTPVAAYPPPLFKAAGLYSEESGTYFWAFITGPSPTDVASFTVTGPSGSFDMQTSLSFRQLGLMYFHGEESILPNGSYTFLVTDSLGRSVSLTKDFVYDNNVPEVDPSTMRPQNGAYVETTTPTLSFDPVTGREVYYQVFVQDPYSQDVWFSGPNSRSTSVTIPEGLLQPNTTYQWDVRVWDRDPDGQNRTRTELRYFFTGTRGIPDLANRYVLSFPSADGNIGNWMGVANIEVAPWDIVFLRVTGPDSTVYDLTQTEARFDTPALRLKVTYTPAPITNGTYRFDFEDDEGNTASTTQSYTYKPVPGVSEESRDPADNAYFDTGRPTFSWAPVEGSDTYYYQLRIHDYGNRIKWYTSERGTETSVTIPEGVNLPRGSSFGWQVLVWDADTNNLNLSSIRSFTLSAAAPTVTTDPASSVSTTSATLNGKVNPNGASITYYFEYGPTTDYGSTTQVTSLVSGTVDVPVAADLTGLSQCAIYHYRIVATNYSGASYGEDTYFNTSGCTSHGGCFVATAISN